MRTNYFVTDVFARGTDGHIKAEDLSRVIAEHDGREAYHCAFELDQESLKVEVASGKVDAKGKPVFSYVAQSPEHVAPLSFNKYAGVARGTLGYAWFDFDSSDGGDTALTDVRAFTERLGHPAHIKYYYSGSKGFHVAIPMGYFNLQASKKLPAILNHVATSLKRSFYKSLDTTVFNAQRKFRALGTKHSKTGLYKIEITHEELKTLSIAQMRDVASARGSLIVSEAPFVQPVPWLSELAASFNAGENDSLSLKEWARYKRTSGERAMNECEFLKHCKENAKNLSEPEWYAAASIVGRFEDGRAKFQALSKGHPEYSVQKTDDKLDQALGSTGPRTCKGIQSIWGRCFQCSHFEKIKSPVVILETELIPTEATGFHFVETSANGVEKRTPDYGGLLKAFTRQNPFVVISEMKIPFLFEKTHYVPTNLIEVKAFAETNFSPEPREAVRNEFNAKVMANNVRRKNFFHDTITDKINFLNGVLDLKEMVLIPHDKDFGFRSVLPYNYDPEAKCPTFEKWISEIMFRDASLVAVLQEFMGYVVRGGPYNYHKALWLAGSGRNGKSTFVHTLKKLIGNCNYSTLSIRAILTDRFAAADLDGKIANFSEETSPEELSDSGPFKNLTGDGEMTAQRKYGDPYTFQNVAKLIMTYNEIPVIKDLSPGMLSRPLVIPFKMDLMNEADQDKSLPDKLANELSGIFNYAFQGWMRLDKQKRFSSSVASVEALQEVREESDTAYQWFKEYVRIVGGECFVSSKFMYENYKQRIGQYALSDRTFYRRLKNIPELKNFTCKRDEVKGFRNIKIVDSGGYNAASPDF